MLKSSPNAARQSLRQSRTVLSHAVALVLGGFSAVAVAEPNSTNAGAMLAVADVEFNTAFFSSRGIEVDVSRFERGAGVLPGEYSVDIALNGSWQGRQQLRFREVEDGSVRACLSRQMLEDWGVDLGALEASADKPEELLPLPEGDFCADLASFIPNSSLYFDSSAMQVNVSVPQAFTRRTARGWVDPSRWDAGVSAASIAYDSSIHRNFTQGRSNTSGYLGVRSKLNAGGWQLRHDGSYLFGTGRQGTYRASQSYAQRDLPSLRSQLILGQTSTAGTLFNSIGFTGARLYSDDRMLPDSQRGYAPTIRGNAATNAKVSVYQRGYLLHEITVAPGLFVIDDLYPTGFGGDLDVVVTEADGREQRFSVPFAAVPQLLRPGTHRFSVSAGRVRDLQLRRDPHLVEGTWQQGVTNTLTTYGGILSSQGYGAVQVGAAFNTPWGAFAGDITNSRTELPLQTSESGRQMIGQSLRFSYSKILADTGTNFSLAAYRYSTDGYLDLVDALRMRQQLSEGQDFQKIARQRHRFDVNVSQDLGEGNGRLWLTGSATSYWNRNESQRTYSAGYSNTWRTVSYSIFAQRNRISEFNSGIERTDTQYNISFTVPLGRAPRQPLLTARYRQAPGGSAGGGIGVTGTSSHDINYGASLDHNERGDGTTFNTNASYRGSNASVSANYTDGDGYRQLGAGLRGGVVIHPGGVTLAQDVGETIGIVHAPGAAGASVSSAGGVRVDKRGYAVVPYLTPYRMNDVNLDPKGLPLDVELETTLARSAPRAGAVVSLPFVARSGGRSVLIHATQADGSSIPFGADVLDSEGNAVGVVGQASRLWMRGVADRGDLFVKWGESPDQQCRVSYSLPASPADGLPIQMKKLCRPGVGEQAQPVTESMQLSETLENHTGGAQ
ncbi:fimbria/pilus outer membrane usher protein [Stenotrophomonas sp. SAU14A_NAIMI4_8]|uniref:fimbria/pilus outer membrane usher protein n=1 Tax=Stenotrophomonas sp. SAU14A_NAIMI4_8 TaxID=2072409 RepID=UPI000D53C4B9|nr:fimbria/pilus outer membrane usher protein [Stenotrophomonas sp. SAU14A_NAIMI4_8]AWH33921.1 hypothetical protein C1930_14160 [Stenotrophomonas sp. SAU14A_NAIMI4_8]